MTIFLRTQILVNRLDIFFEKEEEKSVVKYTSFGDKITLKNLDEHYQIEGFGEVIKLPKERNTLSDRNGIKIPSFNNEINGNMLFAHALNYNSDLQLRDRKSLLDFFNSSFNEEANRILKRFRENRNLYHCTISKIETDSRKERAIVLDYSNNLFAVGIRDGSIYVASNNKKTDKKMALTYRKLKLEDLEDLEDLEIQDLGFLRKALMCASRKSFMS